VIEDFDRLPGAAHLTEIISPADGFVADMDPYAVGVAVALLGGGRKTATDRIDLGVGVVVRKKRGEAVMAGKPVFEVHHGGTGVPEALDLLRGCFRISDNPPPPQPLILEVLQ
jgi:pyrimidine-nucleoside phosphorylase